MQYKPIPLHYKQKTYHHEKATNETNRLASLSGRFDSMQP